MPTHASFATSGRGGSSLNPANHHEVSVPPLVDLADDNQAAGPVAAEKKKKKPRFAVDGDVSGDEEGDRDGRMRVEGAGKRTKAEVFLFEYGVVSQQRLMSPALSERIELTFGASTSRS